MDPIRYEAIAQNVGRVEVEGNEVRVVWRCAATGREVGRSSAWMAADPSLGARVGANVKRTIASELIYGAARMLSGVLGGVVGRVVSGAAYTAATDINQKLTADVDYTDASRQAAVVAAFESVKEAFVWDAEGGRFIARPPAAQA
jgi:hypothetical protein